MTKPKQDSSRCQHRDAANRRCSMPRIDTHPAFCYLHSHAERAVREAEISLGSEGYENLVRDVVDPLPDSLPEVSSAPATSPQIAASALAPQTGASAEPRVG